MRARSSVELRSRDRRTSDARDLTGLEMPELDLDAKTGLGARVKTLMLTVGHCVGKTDSPGSHYQLSRRSPPRLPGPRGPGSHTYLITRVRCHQPNRTYPEERKYNQFIHDFYIVHTLEH